MHNTGEPHGWGPHCHGQGTRHLHCEAGPEGTRPWDTVPPKTGSSTNNTHAQNSRKERKERRNRSMGF